MIETNVHKHMLKKTYLFFLFFFCWNITTANNIEHYQELIKEQLSNPNFYNSLSNCIDLSTMEVDIYEYESSLRHEAYGELLEKGKLSEQEQKTLLFLTGIDYLYSKEKELATTTFLEIYKSYPDNSTKSDITYWIGLSYFRRSDIINAQTYLEECRSVSNTIGNDDKILKSNYYLGLIKAKVNACDQAIQYYEASLKVAKRLKTHRWVSACYRKIGICYKNMNQFAKSLEYYKAGIKYGIDNNYTERNDLLHLNVGKLYMLVGDFDKAVLEYEYSYNIRKEKNDIEPMTVCLANIGEIYLTLGDYPKAFSSFQEAYQLAQNNDLQERALYFQVLMGEAYSLNGTIEKADSLLNYCLDGYQKMGLVKQEISCLYNLGNNLLFNKQYDDALPYFLNAKEKIKDMRHQNAIQIENGLAEIYLSQKKYKKAINLGNSVLARISDNSNTNRVTLISAMDKLTNAYQAIGNFKAALDISNKRNKLEREIFDESKLREVGKFEMRMLVKEELDTKQKAIDYLQIQNKNHELSIEKRNLQVIIAAILLAFSFLLAGILLFFLKKNKQKNQKLMLLNKEQNQSILIIEKQKEALKTSVQQLKISQSELKQSNNELELVLDRREKLIRRLQKFASVLAHDFKEPVRTILSFGKLLNRSIIPKIDEREKEFFNFIISSTTRLNDMVDRLYAYSANTLVLMNKFQMINLEDIIESVQKDLNHKLVQSKGHVEVEPFHHLILGDNILLYQLFQNLIANALKYSKVDHPARISIKNELINNQFVVSVTDNGVGIEHDSSIDIFALFSRTQNTSDRDGHGLGLATCKEVLEIHGGKIDYTSEIGVGTTFYLYFKDFKKIENTVLNH